MGRPASADELEEVSPPIISVYRVARRGSDPFTPLSWDYAGADGTFGNRFDDPSQEEGRPDSERYRMVYCASQRAAAFAETIARFRPAIRVIAGLEAIDHAEPIGVALHGLVDPEDPSRRVIPADWRIDRQLAEAVLDPGLRFVDIASARTLHRLRQEFAPVVARLGLSDLDLSAVTGPHRRLAQMCARYIYDQADQSGQPRYAGIRYLSRLNGAWACWAVFADRMRHSPKMPVSIFPDDPGLVEAAAMLGLTIESFGGHYLRPWR